MSLSFDLPCALPALYRGRFAPTPSGPLHLGSLSTALASWLHAQQHGGQWWIRIDDLDSERCRPEHSERILKQLAAHGLRADGVVYQSQRLHLYEAAFQRLPTYPCTCTRAEVLAESIHGAYSGRCRQQPRRAGTPAWRLALPDQTVGFEDGVLGKQTQRLHGDPILKRRDGIYGYHLVCAVDEIEMNISHVWRGEDLLDSSFVQQHLITLLGGTVPQYGHLPLLYDGARKLSKQNRAPAIEESHALQNLYQCRPDLPANLPKGFATVTDVLHCLCAKG
jgi:glutamyl-Q tRNA(Asp) synthetase